VKRLAVAATLGVAQGVLQPVFGFAFEDVAAQAQALAAQPYRGATKPTDLSSHHGRTPDMHWSQMRCRRSRPIVHPPNADNIRGHATSSSDESINLSDWSFRMKLAILSTILMVASLAFTGPAQAQKGSSPAHSAKSKPATDAPDQVRLTRVTPEYWRVTFHNPPFNIYGPKTMPQLNKVVTAIETDALVKVVVFDSDVPDFFLTHYDFLPPLTDTTSLPPGPTGLPQFPDMLVRLSKAPVVSIASIRGRATGVGSELALASDMRFASREKAMLSQFEIGAGFAPGGGPMARLPHLMGRGRALEVLMTGSYLNGDLAERSGYDNRSLPDAELDTFVDGLARRIAGFDKQTITDIKRLVDAVSLPTNEQLGAEWEAFLASVQRPAAQQRIGKLMELGLQTNGDLERRLDEFTGKLGNP
jgi:enoyl-CoA hydratase/carnithine racemase